MPSELKILPESLFTYTEADYGGVDELWEYYQCKLVKQAGIYQPGHEFPLIQIDITLGLLMLYELDPMQDEDDDAEGSERKAVAIFKLEYSIVRHITKQECDEFVHQIGGGNDKAMQDRVAFNKERDELIGDDEG